MQLSPESPVLIQQSAFYTQFPFVKRVVIISITQHGVILAASQIVTVLVAKLVILPLTIVKTTAQMAEMAAASDDEKLATMLSSSQTSIVSMNANNHICKHWHPYPCQPIFRRIRLSQSKATDPSKKGMMGW